MILESLGWNEITLLIHCRKFSEIATFIELIRACTFDDLTIPKDLLHQEFGSISKFYGKEENRKKAGRVYHQKRTDQVFAEK